MPFGLRQRGNFHFKKKEKSLCTHLHNDSLVKFLATRDAKEQYSSE